MKGGLNGLQFVLGAALVVITFLKSDRKARLFACGLIWFLMAITNAFEAGRFGAGEKDILPFIFLVIFFALGALCFSVATFKSEKGMGYFLVRAKGADPKNWQSLVPLGVLADLGKAQKLAGELFPGDPSIAVLCKKGLEPSEPKGLPIFSTYKNAIVESRELMQASGIPYLVGPVNQNETYVVWGNMRFKSVKDFITHWQFLIESTEI